MAGAVRGPSRTGVHRVTDHRLRRSSGMTARLLITALLLALAVPAAAAPGRIYGPSTARINTHVQVGATGLGKGRYVLTFGDPSAARPATCGAFLGSGRTSRGRLDLIGKIPSGLTCVQPDGSLPVRVDVRRGHTYRFVICKPLNGLFCDGRKPVRTRSVRITG